jgi:excisionase family DNA binding protein
MEFPPEGITLNGTRYLTLDEAARTWNVSPAVIRYRLKQGRLTSIQHEGRTLLHADLVNALTEGRLARRTRRVVIRREDAPRVGPPAPETQHPIPNTCLTEWLTLHEAAVILDMTPEGACLALKKHQRDGWRATPAEANRHDLTGFPAAWTGARGGVKGFLHPNRRRLWYRCVEVLEVARRRAKKQPKPEYGENLWFHGDRAVYTGVPPEMLEGVKRKVQVDGIGPDQSNTHTRKQLEDRRPETHGPDGEPHFWMTTKEAAFYLEVGTERVAELARRGLLPCRQARPGRKGRPLWFRADQLAAYRYRKDRLTRRERWQKGRERARKPEEPGWEPHDKGVYIAPYNPADPSPLTERSYGEFYTVRQAAQKLGVSPGLVRRCVKSGRLPGWKKPETKHHKGGARWWFIRKEDLHEYMLSKKPRAVKWDRPNQGV